MGLVLDLDEAEDDGLWPDHLPAWRAWCAVSGQWRTQVVAGLETVRVIWLGLDYGAARAALELAGLAMTPGLWSEVRLIEQGAIEELNGGR